MRLQRFELAVRMDGKGFPEGSQRMSLGAVLEQVAKDVRSGDNGLIKDWYGTPVGTWAFVNSQTNS